MAATVGYETWKELLRFEKKEEDDCVLVEVNDDNGNNLFNYKCNGADVELLNVGAGDGGTDKVDIKVKLDPTDIASASVVQPNANMAPYYQDVKPMGYNQYPPNTKYRTSSVEVYENNAPIVKLYCLDNYKWELHVNSFSENVYRIYSYDLKVNGDTDDCAISLKEGSTLKPICTFAKRLFSTSSAKVSFQTEVTKYTLRLLISVLVYFRYSQYGKDVTIDGGNPDSFDTKAYNEKLKERAKESRRSERYNDYRYQYRPNYYV